MIEKKEDNIRSESYSPDSNYHLDQGNTIDVGALTKCLTTLHLKYHGARGLLEPSLCRLFQVDAEEN